MNKASFRKDEDSGRTGTSFLCYENRCVPHLVASATTFPLQHLSHFPRKALHVAI